MVAAFDSLQENESHNSNGSILRRSPRNRKLRGERSEDVKTSKACLQRGVGDEDAASPKQRSSSENTPSEDSSNDQVIGEPSSARKILFQDIEMDEAEAAFDREVEAALEEVQSKLVAVEQRLGTLDQSDACADENNNVPVAGPSGVRKVRQKSDDFYHSFSDDSSDKSSSMPKNFMYTERPNAKDGVCNNLFILCLVCLKTFQKTGDVEKHWRRTHSANN